MRGDGTVVIPQRNLGGMTLGCIEALRRWEGEVWPIVVVDDGSDDGSVELIQQANLANCRVITQEARGVTAAWNVGIRETRTERVVLMNNDVKIGGKFLDELLSPLRNEKARLAGAEWREERFLPPQLRERFPARRMLAGWCLAFDRELWRRLGGFDELLQLYFSDTDFQYRAAPEDLPARLPISAPTALPLTHVGHQTTRRDPQRALLWRHDRDRFLAKWDAGNAAAKRR